MAVTLEVVGPDGSRTWRRLDSLPLTIGRGLANDLILTDPYVDARHARISLYEGRLQLEDLGSVNGIVAGESRTRTSIAVEPGVEVRIGRTRLRFRDTEEPVAPALVEEPVGAAVSDARAEDSISSGRGRALRWPVTPRRQLALAASAIFAFACWSWLTSFDGSGLGDVVSGVGGFAVLGAAWAGLWAVASRATVRRFNYLGHFAVVAVIVLIGLAWSVVEDWLAFFLPDATLLEAVSTVTMVATLCALIAGHLAFASTMSRRRRWRLGLVIAGGAIGILGLAALAATEEFTDVPTFSNSLKPVRADLIPTSSVEDFSEAMRDLKREVDEMAMRE